MALQIMQPQNIEIIVQSGPQILEMNKTSTTRCINTGKALLMHHQLDGMSDELYSTMLTYIERSKKTVKKIADQRAPITKLFDSVRSQFTAMEAEINPTNKDTIPWQIQQICNQYAAAKLAEQQRKAREAAEQAAREKAIQSYTAQVEDFYRRQLAVLVNGAIAEMTRLNNLLTAEPDNYAIIMDGLVNTPEQLNPEWITGLSLAVIPPHGISQEELNRIASSVRTRIAPQLSEQYAMEVGDTRRSFIERLPSKMDALRKIAQGQAEEAERMRKLIEQREKAEAEQREKARMEAEQREKAEAEAKQKAAEMAALFGSAAAQSDANPLKAQVSKKMNVLNPEGFMDIIGLWWSQKGCTMTVDELSKEFKKQITFCNKLANDKSNPLLIQSEHIEYVDDVKAK